MRLGLPDDYHFIQSDENEPITAIQEGTGHTIVWTKQGGGATARKTEDDGQQKKVEHELPIGASMWLDLSWLQDEINQFGGDRNWCQASFAPSFLARRRKARAHGPRLVVCGGWRYSVTLSMRFTPG